MILNKESREAFVDSVVAALPPLDEPDVQAMVNRRARELEDAVLPPEVLAFRDTWTKYFDRGYSFYIDRPRWFDVVKGAVKALSGGHMKMNCAVPITSEDLAEILDAIQEVESMRRDRAQLILSLRAAVAGVRTVAQLKALYPELAQHVKVVERQLPVVTDGSALIAELARAGMQFAEGGGA